MLHQGKYIVLISACESGQQGSNGLGEFETARKRLTEGTKPQFTNFCPKISCRTGAVTLGQKLLRRNRSRPLPRRTF